MAGACNRHCHGNAPAESCGQPPMIRCLKMGSELFDGCASMIISLKDLRTSSALESIEIFLTEGEIGDETTLEVVEMLEYDYDRLPDL